MSRRLIGSVVLILAVLGVFATLGARKVAAVKAEKAAASQQPEPMEVVSAATVAPRDYRGKVTAIGTVLAIRSVTLRNELAGTVRDTSLEPGRIVKQGAVLVALDVSVEKAELTAQKARAQLAQTILDRNQQAMANDAVSQVEVDRARAERDVALAEVARTEAVIERKTIRAPFAARIGMSDIHVGQYLSEGTELTTLQGLDNAVHVDFSVPQRVAATLKKGDNVAIVVADGQTVAASIVAVDAKIDPATRNAWIRARLAANGAEPAPGSSVRVEVPEGPSLSVVAMPVVALRKGPQGDHVFVIEPAENGALRAHVRAVQSGPVLGEEVLVLDGLKPGEQVATSGSFKLREAVLVAVAKEGQSKEGQQ